MTASEIQSVAPLLAVAFVVLRFARRELRERVVKPPGLWGRPAVLLAIAALLVWQTLALDPAGIPVMVASLAGGIVLGAITGALIVRHTSVRPAPQPGALIVKGDATTLAVWIGALLVRVVARFLVPHGGSPLAQLPLNCGTVALVAVAFTTIAAAFARVIAAQQRATVVRS